MAHIFLGGAPYGRKLFEIKFKIIQIFRRDVGMVGGVENYGELWVFLFEGLMGIFVKKITRFLSGGAHRRGPGRNRGVGRWRCAGAT